MSKKLDVKKLALILHEEFEADSWGDIDPYLFEHVAKHNEGDEPDDNDEDAENLRQVLARVVARLEQA